MASELSEKIAWAVIIIGSLMQLVAGSFADADATIPFTSGEDSESVTSAVGAVFDFVIGFLQQSWASGFPPVFQFAIAVIFGVAILLLVSGSTALLVTTIIAGIIAFIEALVPG